ncbi:archaetidylserine decarboxylase [Congregibacter sp.]|uniref:archaetidylserine decarboxylase n=1 Tax=Congregibacter sp. TaxID=2744308 RepID=UPI003F6B9EB9
MNGALRGLSQQEQLNFLLTNRIPRRLATRFMGWYSRIDSPLLTRISIKLWQLFADDLHLEEARQKEFRSLGECFTRQLKPGVRPVDQNPAVITSPCDAIVGEFGELEGETVYQAKGFPYELSDLIPSRELQDKYRNGWYITLRLKSSMYHRFHAPIDCWVDRVTYLSGDTWNVNPISLRRIERLYCKNERAILDLRLDDSDSGICLVAVAAILVASIRLHSLPDGVDVRSANPEHLIEPTRYAKGEEIGYFQHGSTIIVFATRDFAFSPGVRTGQQFRMGEALFRAVKEPQRNDKGALEVPPKSNDVHG